MKMDVEEVEVVDSEEEATRVVIVVVVEVEIEENPVEVTVEEKMTVMDTERGVWIVEAS